jgi:Holliday junction resolvasome RuvABC endonuclease subunit
MKPRTILALDPGLRDLGYAVITGRRITAAGVKPLRLVRPHRRLLRARSFLRDLTHLYEPGEIAVEKTHGYPAGLHKLNHLVLRLARTERLKLAVYSPQTVRRYLLGNGWATKRDVATAIAAKYPAFRVYLTQDRKWKERYWQNMFDAIAVGLHHRAQPLSRSR